MATEKTLQHKFFTSIETKTSNVRIPMGEEGFNKVAIIGRGSFGLALSKEFARAGIPVCIGSRTPTVSSDGIPTMSIRDAIHDNNIIILAIPYLHQDSIPLAEISLNQIVIDCSNRVKICKSSEHSQAELLQAKLPAGCAVVKALNTLSAYEIENRTRTIKEVPIASDSKLAKDKVTSLLHVLSYHAYDHGNLKAARLIENIPLQLFPVWQTPLAIAFLMWIFMYFLQFGRSYLCRDNTIGWHPTEEIDCETYSLLTDMFFKDIIKACDGQALNLLAACYLPGVLAAYIQLMRGSKYAAFPRWLNSWMLMRKYLGLLMLLSASVHACMYCLTLKPDLGELPWNKKAYYTTGVLGFAMAVILGISSLPSVSSSFSWREFRAIQSVLGWSCLVLCSLHATFNALSPPKAGQNYKLFTWKDCYFGSTEQVALILPVITFILKLPLLLPWVDYRLTKIRQGIVFNFYSGWNGLRVFGIDFKI
ncbi:metalloreductase STEAP4 [Eurytemora carolleeae]|uniref:metalloreductase STEAP4 n=1 Tax=Eurytemora carolleeae TaxID=1294199 RepID=UPI000C77900A|nr:metalloreductase STEAP4 [Eurytemora carolleeae]|eukprot:XP_023341911.1 metalloreductase STEAP4-like [Eurytemora affinis]